ncbi:unnamed protein product [Sphagnum jensenii]
MKVDAPQIAPIKSTHRYVTVPDTDMFDMPHPGVRLNSEAYGPGTHYLDKERADTVEACLKDYERANIRILQPRLDEKSVNQVNKGSQRGMEFTTAL